MGGFVSMEGEEQRSSEVGSFSQASIPKRIAIVLAGGMVNIIFGLLVYFTLISVVGNNASNVVDTTVNGYGAQIAGIQPGDQILKINNTKIRLKSDLDDELANCNGELIDVQIKRDGQISNIQLQPTEVPVRSTGIYLAGNTSKNNSTKIVKIEEGSSSEKARFRSK